MNRLHSPDRARTSARRSIPEPTALPDVGYTLGMAHGHKLIGHLPNECEQLGPIFRLRLGDRRARVAAPTAPKRRAAESVPTAQATRRLPIDAIGALYESTSQRPMNETL